MGGCRAENLVCTIWHPAITPDLVRQATTARLLEICAETVDEALNQSSELSAVKANQRRLIRRSELVLLKMPRELVERLRGYGFHTGYWRDSLTDVDRGLIGIFAGDERDRVPRLRDWIRELQAEAEHIHNGVVAVWHPEASVSLLEEAFNGPTFEINTFTIDEALKMWEDHKRAGDVPDVIA